MTEELSRANHDIQEKDRIIQVRSPYYQHRQSSSLSSSSSATSSASKDIITEVFQQFANMQIFFIIFCLGFFILALQSALLRVHVDVALYQITNHHWATVGSNTCNCNYKLWLTSSKLETWETCDEISMEIWQGCIMLIVIINRWIILSTMHYWLCWPWKL